MLTNADNCCGCGLCVEVCPTDAIQMKRDTNGFVYPEIDKKKCTGCNKCDLTCSFRNKNFEESNKKPIKQYIARSRNNETLDSSSSGGLFTEISDGILRNNGVIYGVGFDTNFNVFFKRAKDSQGRNLMRGSKYIQSEMNNVYSAIADDLSKGAYTLFTGTPCQVAAIRSFCLMKNLNIDRLILCDVICHGVSSPLVWEKYLEFIKQTYYMDRLISVNFRDKSYGSGYNMCIKSETVVYHKYGIQDPFIKIFSSNFAMRYSCNHCPLKSFSRVSDLTIGDFQNEKKYYRQFADGKGVSVVLVNSEKGEKLFNHISSNLDFCVCTMEEATQVNLYRQVEPSKSRVHFFNDVHTRSFKSVLRKYTEYGLINHIVGSSRRFAKKLISRNI